MSLKRLVYYSAVIGGWSAFFGWLIAEFVLLGGKAPQRTMDVAIMCAAVGAAIGAGLNVVAGMSNAQWKQLLFRIWPGLLGGGLGGALGGSLGDVMKTFGIPRAIGFMFVGIAVGVVDGAYERSQSKIRNGIVGGAIGGVLGGIALDWMLGFGQGISSRATAFVLLGICIGALVGLTQVVLREAWLEVLEGYGVGREHILSKEVTVLGRADYLPLPFLGPLNTKIGREHLRIIRQSDGRYVLEDNDTALGTIVNGERVTDPSPLAHGALIKFGPNLVKFRERRKTSTAPSRHGAAATGLTEPATNKPLPPPPPVKKPPAPPKRKEIDRQPSPPNSAKTDAPTPQAGQSTIPPKKPPPPPPRKQ